MGRRSDIRRIGAIMRQGGADGSLVAWVEAEFERIDFAEPAQGCLATLVGDLSVRERRLILSALVTVAIEGPKVRAEGLDAAVRLGRELGFDVLGVERRLRQVSGWSMQQARELAQRGLPASTSPAALAEARRAPSSGGSARTPRASTEGRPSGGAGSFDEIGPPSLPHLDEVQFDLPELTATSSGHSATGSDNRSTGNDNRSTGNDNRATGDHTFSGDEVTYTGDRTEPHGAQVPRELLEDAPSPQLEPVPRDPSAYDTDKVEAPASPYGAEDADDLGEDPPTVEMAPGAVQSLLKRKAEAREAHPPRFSPVGDLDEGPEPLHEGVEDLEPLDWGDGDAFTVSDFTLSERIDQQFEHDDGTDEEPTRYVRVPREVARALAASQPQEMGRREPTVELPDEAGDEDTYDERLHAHHRHGLHDASGEPEEERQTTAEDERASMQTAERSHPRGLAPVPLDLGESRRPPPLAPAPFDELSSGGGLQPEGFQTSDLELDLEDSDDDARDLDLDSDEGAPPVGFGATMDLDPDDDGSGEHSPSTRELLDLDLEDEPMSDAERALRANNLLHSPYDVLPVRPASDQGMLTGELLPIAPVDDGPELSLDLDEPELSLDPDTGERIAVAGHTGPSWPPSDGALPSALPGLDDDDPGDVQPLERGLAAYWAPQILHAESSDGLTGELHMVDRGDMQDGLTGELRVLFAGDVQDGLTGELKVIDDDLLSVDEPSGQDGLTGELRPADDEPKKRRRRRRRGPDGLTQDLTLLVDGDPNRQKLED